MSLKSIAQLTVIAILVTFATAITLAWRAEQRARAQLEAQLKSAQDQITAATTRQSSRNATLNQQLAELQKKQAAAKTPNEILQALPAILPLPKPLTLDSLVQHAKGIEPCSGQTSACPDAGRDRPCSGGFIPPPVRTTDIPPCVSTAGDQPPGAQAAACVPTNEQSSGPHKAAERVILPIEDLKPLYNSAVQCQACQLQLTAAQANLKDEQTKSSQLSRELTDALRVANGGSPLRRVARAAKWFAVGAAIGAAAAKLTH